MDAIREREIMDEVSENLLNGRSFDMCARSERSAIGYRPPCPRKYWAIAIETIGRMANESDVLAQLASKLLTSIPLYQTNNELRAHIMESAGKAIRDGYLDVIRLASPEPGRRSDAQRAFTLYECLTLDVWLNLAVPCPDTAPGIGWVVSKLIEENRVRMPIKK